MPRKPKADKKKPEFLLKPWLIGQLRRATRKYPPYYAVLNASKETYYIPSKNGKSMKRVKYKCAGCNNWFAHKDVNVDHIESVVPLDGFPTLSNGEPDYNVF